MVHRVRLPGSALIVLPALLWSLGASPLAPFLAAGEEASAPEGESGKLASTIVSRLDELPMATFWDTVARLESMGKDALPGIRQAARAGGEKARLGAAKATLDLGDEARRKEGLKEIAALAEKASDKEVRSAAIDLLGAEDPEDSAELIRKIFERSQDDPEILIPAAKALWSLDQEPRAQAQARSRLLALVGSSARKVGSPGTELEFAL